MSLTAKIDLRVECGRGNLDGLSEIAARVDKFVGAESPEGEYSLGEAVSAIFNGGTTEDIETALALLERWSLTPRRSTRLPAKRKEQTL